MGHGDDQAAGSRPSDLPRRMPDVRTYYNDDVVRSADGEWQIGDVDHVYHASKASHGKNGSRDPDHAAFKGGLSFLCCDST